ncbi:MAG: amidohydrolase family protein [Acidobacteriota bacterium]
MTDRLRLPMLLSCVLAALVAVLRAESPRVFAITNARIVTAVGPVIENGTIVLRNGLIEAAGAGVAAPADARIIDGKGHTVYPGLIDMGTTTPVDVPRPANQPEPATTEQAERAKRDAIFRPGFEAAEHIKTDAADLAAVAGAGITSVLAIPDGTVFPGRSALINVVPPTDDPQIGSQADVRDGLLVVKAPVALHVVYTARPPGGGYPNSLMGVIAFVRQSFLDAQYSRNAAQAYAFKPAGHKRPQPDPGLDALGPALDRTLPVAFAAQELREIRRVLAMASEFRLNPIVVGGLEADQAVAEIKAASAPVIFSLNVPTRPKTLAPDADEPIRVLRQRAHALKVPAALEKAGVAFAFQSGGLKDPKDFLKHAAKAVKEGLAADAAIRALTINAARISGAADRIGSLESGKIANLIVTNGDLFADDTKILHVFVDGCLVPR